MADLTAAGRVAGRRTEPQRRKLRGPSVGAAIGAMARVVGQAFAMAYVAPYQTKRRPPPAAAQAEDGRDPDW